MEITVVKNWPDSYSIRSHGDIICIHTQGVLGMEDVVSLVEDSPSHQWLLTHKDDGSFEYWFHKVIVDSIHTSIIQEGMPMYDVLDSAGHIYRWHNHMPLWVDT